MDIKNNIKNKAFTIFAALFCLSFNLYNLSFALNAAETENKYPDYAQEYLGKDKCETFNRKVFLMNAGFNKYLVRPVNIVWASVMPKYGMDRIQSAYTNIEFPKRVVSCLIQKDFQASGKEVLRFVTNSTLGIAGMYDPAKRYFHIEPTKADMEQALAKCKVKQGPYLVLPILSSSSLRGLAGKLLDTSLDPTIYVASPITAIVKAGLFVNRTSYMQPFAKMIESTYADPYDITKKLYAIENYIKNSNLYRKEILAAEARIIDNNTEVTIPPNSEEDAVNIDSGNEAAEVFDAENLLSQNQPEGQVNVNKNSENNTEQDKAAVNDVLKTGEYTEDNFLKDLNTNYPDLVADIMFNDYNPQNPIVDSMRTALFNLPGISDSIWSELSIWNRSFSNRIKTSSINVDKERENYKFRYILQKDKTAPIAIIYPSIGDGITSHNSVVLAKIFYDEGYSVIIQGSHFHWEFVKSMPEDYKPGIPSRDADYIKLVTYKILNSLQTKYGCKPREKVVIGTSFGALTTLFLADKESKNNTLNITKYISISPPIELLFALKQLDKNSYECNKNQTDAKHRVAITAAKIVQAAQMRNMPGAQITSLPFSEEEAKLITGFILHQKLSDLIFTIEDNPKKTNKSEIYKLISNMSYQDYAERYLLKDGDASLEVLNFDASLHSIEEFLRNNNNYKIYHTFDDYFINKHQLRQLKEYSGNKVVLLSNGSHLGFLYRQEFMDSLRKEISLNKDKEELKQVNVLK